MDKNKKTIDSYDKDAKLYADKFDSYGVRFEAIDRAIKLNESGLDRVLELGCANGRDAEYITAKLGSDNYIGIDAAKGFIDLAINKVPQATFHVKDMREADFAPEAFGIIYSFSAMLHVNRTEMEALLEKCHKWLKVGGILCIETRYGPYTEEKTINFGKERFFYFYQPEDIEKLCPYKFFVVYKEIQDIRGKSWFEIVLRKI